MCWWQSKLSLPTFEMVAHALAGGNCGVEPKLACLCHVHGAVHAVSRCDQSPEMILAGNVGSNRRVLNGSMLCLMQQAANMFAKGRRG